MQNKLPTQLPQKYTCIICFDRCKRAISCTRCHKLICYQHTWSLNNKCPNCRLSPYQFNNQQLIQNIIDRQLYLQKNHMKKYNIFKCLVQGCNFQGKYNVMEYHRKSRHRNQKIDEILFPQQRKNKLKRDALKKIFVDKQIQSNLKYKQLSLPLYVKTRGIFDISSLAHMIQHIDKCQFQQCKEILFDQQTAYIGVKQLNQGLIQSKCPIAVSLKQTV